MMSRRPYNQRLWQSALLFGVAFFVCADLGSLLSLRGNSYVSFWLPAGLYVGVLLLNETRSWIWFLLAAAIANFLFDLLKGTPLVTTLGFYSANTVEAVLGAWLVRRFVAKQLELTNVREFLGLLVCSALLSAMAGSAIGAATLTASGMSHSFWTAWRLWWCNNALAIMLVAPFILVWFSKPDPHHQSFNRRGKLLEATLLAASLVGLAWYILVEDDGVNASYESRLLPLLLWAGMRFGLRGATAANLLLALLMACFTTQFQKGLAPADIASGDYITILQSFLMVSVCVALIPTIVVTEHTRAEESLQEASQFNRQIIGSAQEGIVVFDRDLRYQVWNPFMEQLTGVPAAKVLGRRMEEVFPFLQEVGMAAVLEKGLAGEISGPLDFPFQIQETGRRGWSSRMIAPLRNTKGEVIGVISSVRDITQRKLMEEALRNSESRLRSIFTNAPVGIFQSTVDRFLFVNPAMAKMFGHESPEEMLAGAASPEAFYVHPEQRRQMIREAWESGAYTEREVEERRKDGSVFLAYTHMRVVRDDSGEIKFVEGFVEDITERKRAEAALRLSDFSVNRASLPTFWVAQDSRIVRANHAACALMGYTEAELLQLFITDLNPDRTVETWPAHWQDLRERKHMHFETRQRHKDGHIFPVEVDLNWFEFGGQEYNFAFVRDITTRVLAEQRLQKSHEQLRALSARLQSLREEERTRLAREIHDHLGQLLTALKLDLRLVERRINALPAGEVRDALHSKLASASGLADETINGIQQIASELRPALLDRVGLEAAIEGESHAFQFRAGINCDFSLPARPIDLTQDQATAVFRIFQETLTNVARHARATRVSVRLSQENGSLLLAVTDDGVGIEQADLEHSQSLGLLGMQERAEILGGRIQFDRNSTQGTTVTLRLPL